MAIKKIDIQNQSTFGTYLTARNTQHQLDLYDINEAVTLEKVTLKELRKLYKATKACQMY